MTELNNSIQLFNTDKPHIFNVKLTIQSKSKLIGILDESGEGTFIAIRKENHLFRKNNSLGINYELLTARNVHFKWIVMDFCNRKLVSTREYFLQKGVAMQFKKQGFELQIFIPITEMNINTARAFEIELKKKVIQQSLFNEVE